MRLADFILANIEPILMEWDAFARSIWPGAVTDPAMLRNDAEEMLRATAADMKSDQTASQQSNKSRGKGAAGPESDHVNRASESHGTVRMESGFDLAALIAEYRALRASVIRLWRESRPAPDLNDLDDLTRFNESIDQSLTEAVVTHTKLVARERKAALDQQSRHARQLREVNDALLTSSIQQHELTEKAEKAGTAAHESEQRYRALFDLGPVAVYACDGAGVIADFNRRAEELWGRTPKPGDTDERFCGSLKLFRPDGSFMPHAQCPMADVVSGKISQVRDAEVIIERPDGSRVIVIVNILPLKNEQNEVKGAINCFYDITDHKRAEEALHKSRQDLATELEATQLLQQVSLHMAGAGEAEPLYENIMDAAAAILRSDFASLQRLYPERGSNGELRLLAFRGYSPEAAAAWEWISADHPTSCGMALRTGKRSVVTDVETCHWMAKTEDLALYRQIGLRSLQSTPLISRTGAKLGMISTCWKQSHMPSERDFRLLDILARQAADLLERVLIEDTLRESEARFRMLANNISQLAWTCDKLGNVTWYNQRWLDYTGMSFDDMKGWNWSRVQHPDHLDRVVKRVQRSAETGEMWEDTFPLRGKDGEFRWFLSRAVPIRDKTGRIVSWFGTNTDVTEQREAETALDMARDAAEAANRAKDKFLAVLSHELRTPLTPVVLTIAAMEHDPDLPLKMREDVAMIRRNIELETKLIDDLLDLSRVSTGKLRLQLQPTNTHALLRHIAESSARDAAAKKLKVSLNLKATHDQVNADPARLQQVFWNVLRNAVKFTPEGGHISIRSENDRRGKLRLILRDTGIGIPADVLPKVFDAFEQGDIKTTRHFGGLGLGLAICKAVVEMHGGTIRAESEGAGKGSIFTIELPLVRVKETRSKQSLVAEGSQIANGSRVLLVEDHPDTLLALSRLLGQSGFQVKTANSIASALQLAACETFDLVVSDIGLPDGTGYELMEQIRDRYGIKGIALTGYGMEEDIKRSMEAGFVDHVVKPVDLAQLEAVMRQVVARGGGEFQSAVVQK